MKQTTKNTTDMKAIAVQDANTALQAQHFATEEVIAAFLAQLDGKESSRRLYGRTLRQFFAWTARTGRMLSAMTRADILAYRDGLISGEATTDGAGRSTLTAACYLTAVKLFYKWLASEGAYPNITDGIKLPKRANKFQKEPLTYEQAATLVQDAAGASLRDAAIINLLLRTGLRTIEVVRANIEDLQEKGGQSVLYVQGKGHDSKDNFVILSGKCAAALNAYLQTRTDAAPTAPLFTCGSNNNRGGRLTTRTISGIAKEHLKAIGLNSRSYTAHSLRHTFGCSMLETTGDIHNTQLAMRHSSPATTEIYTYHINERMRLKAAAENQLDKLF